LAAVGGANVPPRQRSRFYDVLRIFLNTYLGAHSSVQGRRFSRDRIVDHLPTVNVLYLKKALAAVNGFDERMGNIGEDQDLSFRLTAHGFSLHYIAGAEVTHALRSNLASWSRNMFIYGTGRMRLMCLHPRRIQVKFIFPLLLVLVLAMVPFIQVLVPVLLYFPAVLLVSLFECVRARRTDVVPDLFAVYISTHVCYGLGEWYGLIRPCSRSRAQPRNRRL
jgi:GT2 family glycosyltransferase